MKQPINYKNFANIINVSYTANMETELDDIAENKINNIEVLKNFYEDFEPLVKKLDEMEKKTPELTGRNVLNVKVT